MGSFITPQFASTLVRSRAARASELRDRTRYMLPLEGGWSPDLATTMSKGRWRVTLDVLLVEKLRTVEVKRVPIRYSIIVEQRRIDPEYNPWGLYLDGLRITALKNHGDQLVNLPLRFAMVIAFLPIAISRSDSVIEYEWTGDPIPVDLSVGVERRITVKGADELRIGIPPNLHDKFTAQSIKDSSWWKSDTPIDSVRVIIGVIPTGEFVVTEVTASGKVTPLPDIVIRIPNAITTTNAPSAPTNQSGFAALTRWTIQQLYSPDRLRRPLTGVTEDTVNKKPMKLFSLRPVHAIRLWRVSRSDSGRRLAGAKPLRHGGASREHDRRADRIGSPRYPWPMAHRSLCPFKAHACRASALDYNTGSDLRHAPRRSGDGVSMKLLRQYLKGIVIFLAMAVFGVIFYFGGSNETSQNTQKSESSSAESDSTSEEVRAAVTQMTDLQKKIESLQEQLAAQAIEDEELKRLTEERISAVQERLTRRPTRKRCRSPLRTS